MPEIADFKLPEYFPLHSSLVRKFEKVQAGRPTGYDLVEKAVSDIVHSTKEYIEFILKNEDSATIYVDDSLLSNNLEAMKELIRTTYDLNLLQDSTKESRLRIRQESREDQPLTLETLQDLTAHNDSIGKVNFDETIINDYENNVSLNQTQDSLRSFLNSAASYQYVKSVSFILTHPEDPLPDDTVVDDDVEVAGGKISLKDPISLQYFTDPIKSKKCLHVFEKSSINSMFGNGRNTIECPTDGCKAQITRSDLYPDELMQLRVRVYLAANKRR